MSTFGEDPVDLQMGDGTLQPGLELALYGLRPGDTQTLKLLPDQAYGPRDPSLIQYMPLTDFDGEFTPEAGQIIAFALPNGEEAAGMVLGGSARSRSISTTRWQATRSPLRWRSSALLHRLRIAQHRRAGCAGQKGKDAEVAEKQSLVRVD